MEETVNKLENKLDLLDTRLDKITIILVKQEQNLKLHMKRSELNEEAVRILKEEVKPIQEHVLKINFLMKIFAVVGSILGAVYAAIQIAILTK